MIQERRKMMRISAALGAAFAAGLSYTADVFAGERSQTVSHAKNLEDTVKEMGGATSAASQDVSTTGPHIPEDGAVVPVSIASQAPNTDFMAILVEKNPSAMSASFNIPAGTEPAVTTRVKMGATSNVHA